MKKLLMAVWLAVAVVGFGTGCNPTQPQYQREPLPEATTPEEKQVRKEARTLGDRLYTVVKDNPEPMKFADEDAQQQKLSPVYDDIEKFIFRQLQPYKERIASITVVYKNSGILCIVYVKSGNEEELAKLKRATDSCVGKIVDNLPIVRYLIVRNQHD